MSDSTHNLADPSRPNTTATSPLSRSTSSSSTTQQGDLESRYVELEPSARPGSASGRKRRASNAASFTERQIYGEMSEDRIELQRKETLRELAELYQTRTEDKAELDAPDDASEFRDIDPELVTWDGPDDTDNPRNFAARKKWLITSIVSLYTFITPFASSIVAPAAAAYSLEFGITNPTVASLTVSIFLLGYAIGPLFFAPLSEMYGRVIVLQTAMVFFFIFNVACAVSQTTGQMIAFRLLAGIVGSAPLGLGAGVLGDLWTSKELAMAIAFFSLGPILGPVIAPVISGFIVENVDWRWVFWILCIVSGLTSVIGFFVFKDETYGPIILNRRAARLRKESGNPHLHTVFEISKSPRTMWKISLTRPFKLLVLNPMVFLLGLFMAFTYGFLYLMFVTFPPLFKSVYGFSTGMAGLAYLGPGIGSVFGLAFFTPLMQKIYLRMTAANGGVAKPEYRLPPLFIGGPMLAIGLFWYGWGAEKHIHWVFPLIGTALVNAGIISVFGSCQSYLIDMSPRYSASAVSAATVFRSLFGFAFPLFGGQMYDKLGYGWGNSLMGFIALPLGILFPFYVFRYGEKLRATADRRMEKSEEGMLSRGVAKAEKRAEEKSMKESRAASTAAPSTRPPSQHDVELQGVNVQKA